MSRFVVASLLVLASMPLAAQIDRFEVASVRAKGSPEALPLITVEPGGRFVAPNSTLRELVRTAYGIDDNRIVGGPDWMNRERFAIEARAGDPSATGDRIQRMLAALLADRFKLAAHRETRELPVFVLRLAREDGRPASAMRTASAECIAIVPPAGVPPAPPPPPATTGTRPRPLVPANAGLRCPVHFFPGWIAGRAITMAQFAQRLAPFVNRPVVDRTGLGGEFDFELAFTPERPPILNGGALPPTSDGASIFTAIREQLGLALDPQRAPLEVLVIDSAERPSEN